MLERFTYNNFKNLAKDTATSTLTVSQMSVQGLIAGSVMAALSPSQSNLPTWIIDTMSKTNNTAITYLSNHLDATYVLAPAVAFTILPLVKKTIPLDNSDEPKDSESANGTQVMTVMMRTISLGILGTSICSRLGYDMSGAYFLAKGFGVPMLTYCAIENLLDAALPLPKKNSDMPEAATV